MLEMGFVVALGLLVMLAHKSLGEMERELAAFYVAERPSRRGHPGQFGDTVAVPIQSAENRKVVYLRGVPHFKTQAWEGGRKVTTYKPLAPTTH
jgi:hypothetical protein